MKVIFTTGAFDLLHKNHIKFLKKCKEYGNYLIVGLCSDKLLKSYKREPILSYCQRYKMLNELSFIDKIIKIDLFTKNIPIKFYIENKIDYQVQINSDKVKYYNRKDIKFIFINPSYGLHTTNIINKIQNKITKVCLVGGTSTTHYLASILGEKPDFKVNILTRNPSKWSTTINCLDKSDYIIATGIINKISDDPKEVIPDSNIIIISVPSFCLEDIVKKISPYITENTIIGKLPGTGGFDWIIKKYITTKNITFFGTQRLPFVVRKINYGHSCLVYGHKKKIPFCCIPNSESDNVKKILNEIFTYDCIPLDNYLNITLVPSNPILHTSRFYSLFKNWTNNVKYDKPIKFYEEWDDISYENLKGCDNEVQKICNSLPNMENVLSLEKSYIYNYGDNIKDTTNLLTMIKSNKAYAGILTPMKKIDNTYIPDFESRYLTEDIPFGLVILKAIALILDIKTPYFDKILLWGQNIINKEYLVDNKLIGKNINEIIIPQHFNIKNKNDLINFNKNELNKYNKLLILCTNSDPNKTRPIGQIRNKDTFNFPTKLEILKNVSLSNLFKKKNIINNCCNIINKDNNKYITTSCGFFYYLQKDIVNKLNKKIFISSSLIQLPLLLMITPKNEKIGIITANSNHLNSQYLSSFLSIDSNRIVVYGMQNKKEFRECIIENKRITIDLELLKNEIIENISKLLFENKDISLLLIECTDIDFAADDIRKKFKIPVYNLISLLNMIYQ